MILTPQATARAPTVAHPLLAAVSARTFGLSYRSPAPQLTTALAALPAPSLRRPGPVIPRRQALRSVAPVAATRAHAYSRNWAGAVVPATRGERFSLITGSWKVPFVADPATTNPQGPSRSYVSVWVGLGGSYGASRSMPQLGSEHGWENGQAVHRLWCQWWRGPGIPEGYLSQWITNAVVNPGDTITVWLEVDATETTVTFHWACNSLLFCATATATATGTEKVMADTANWVVERPTQVVGEASGGPALGLGGHHPLPDFGRSTGAALPTGEIAVTMTDCVARLGPANNPETVRRPMDGDLVSLRSIVPGVSRSFIELEPAMTIDPPGSALDIVRHLP